MDIKTKIKQVNVSFCGKNINMNIYDYKQYTNNNDEGKDLISLCLERDKCWEPYEFEVSKEIVKCGGDLVVDIGSHLGTYSILSSVCGNRTIAIDGNKNVNNIFRKTIKENNLSDITVLDMYITKDTDLTKITTEKKIRLLKVDVGGEERSVYNVFKSMFENKQIDYAVFEITSRYLDRYGFVDELHKMGYKVFDLGLSPQRKLVENTEHLYSDEFWGSEITGKFEKYIRKLPQKQSNFLFKSDQMDEVCKCGANMNVFDKPANV